MVLTMHSLNFVFLACVPDWSLDYMFYILLVVLGIEPMPWIMLGRPSTAELYLPDRRFRVWVFWLPGHVLIERFLC